MKLCTKCKLLKPYSEFHKDRSDKTAYQSACKICKADHRREHYSQNKEYMRKKFSEWNKNSREKRSKWVKNNSKKWSLINRRSILKRHYNLTPEQYEELLQSQNMVCAICHKTDTTRLAVDHDHFTGHVRGLLCGICNRGLGNFKDDTELLQKAIQYLNKPSHK
jgi:hypothetical protein